ncbi:MAG: hypothetical protein ABW042_07000 [Phenylobacterium sp.]
MRAALPALLPTLILLAACGSDLPAGVDEARLTDEIGRAIGDPSTCVLIADAAGRVVYRFGSHTTCGRKLPGCEGDALRTVDALVKRQAQPGRPAVTASCRALEPGRGVAWAAGPVAGRTLTFAAVMDGPKIPPGLVIRDKLAGAFRRAGR